MPAVHGRVVWATAGTFSADSIAGIRVLMHVCAAVFTASVLLVAFQASSASAFVVGPATAAECPACTTAVGQAQAAELAEGLTINGVQSSTFGSTIALAEDAAGSSAGAARGLGVLSSSLLAPSSVEAAAVLSADGGGLAVGAFVTGYTIGTFGRSLVLRLFGGSEGSPAQPASSWNTRWVLCTYDPCVTNLYSSAWSSPVIPFGSMYARFDHVWSNSNVSFGPAELWRHCQGSPPPAAPCEAYINPAAGPQAGDLPGARAVTVYGVGVNERPGNVSVRRIQDLLDPNAPSTVVAGGNVSGAYFGSAPQSAPRSRDTLVSAVDDAITAHPGFGAWVQGQLAAHPAETPDISFPNVYEKWRRHGDELGFDDLMDYWREAVRIVQAGRSGSDPLVRRCVRSDGKELFWDGRRATFVIVEADGTIETMYLRDDDGAYYEAECAQ